jgi:hypothetical protein
MTDSSAPQRRPSRKPNWMLPLLLVVMALFLYLQYKNWIASNGQVDDAASSAASGSSPLADPMDYANPHVSVFDQTDVSYPIMDADILTSVLQNQETVVIARSAQTETTEEGRSGLGESTDEPAQTFASEYGVADEEADNIGSPDDTR